MERGGGKGGLNFKDDVLYTTKECEKGFVVVVGSFMFLFSFVLLPCLKSQDCFLWTFSLTS